MMTVEQLKKYLANANWFARLGTFDGRAMQIAIRNLDAWRSANAVADQFHEHIAEQMHWLPTAVSELDPIHGHSLRQRAREQRVEEQFKQETLAIYKLTLVSLRHVAPTPLLKAGPHDFNPAARGAAAFAFRAAAAEIVTGGEDFWCSLVSLYSDGHWPCGLMADGKVVVF